MRAVAATGYVQGFPGCWKRMKPIISLVVLEKQLREKVPFNCGGGGEDLLCVICRAEDPRDVSSVPVMEKHHISPSGAALVGLAQTLAR